ncbi:hypothetical protein AKJ09_00336 [Labilithrix luteola]|uniref:Probable inorganic carbon transporter subunit DabA n=1 Tax=Labilithrix luteola TaxID=1391654 RepID=A0A0K1PJH3_9BACT|nr:DUF2309 domain-containing protein [Labilithrix luteola]AKU93672.1 hypothetical protein AKJ09_00336 [Labilithrix luteola]
MLNGNRARVEEALPDIAPRSDSRESITLKEAAERACSRIAPSWPLDRFAAVNPFWARTDKPVTQVAGELAALSGARMLMPRAWYAQEWRAGRLRPEHLREAIAQSGAAITEEHLSGLLRIDEPKAPRRPLVVDVMETRCRRELEVSWRDYVVERISRFCASYFDDGQAQVRPVREGGLYASWREQAQGDWGPSLFMGLSDYRSTVRSLPNTADEMLAVASSDLGVPANEREAYLSALLLDINGWASWCAYRRWMARLAAKDDDTIYELLAIRAAWEWIVFRAGGEELRVEWGHAVASWPTFDRVAHSARADDWFLQSAVEIAWMSEVSRKLPEGFGVTRPERPTVQAVFCLDVRSEVFRRALEVQSPNIQTLSCAGFFGIPIEYAPLAADSARPQLPGLLAPKYRVTDTVVSKSLEDTRRSRLQASHAWKAFKQSSLSSFAFVDAMGLFFAGKLFGETFGRWWTRQVDEHEHAGLTPLEDTARTPRITSRLDGTPLPFEERCQLAEGVLRAMSLTRGFARLVLLVGHGAATRNNPYAAGLDCGACCGQTGEVNARAAAALLNDADIRAGLASRGIEIPTTTRFVAALHNTTTDDVSLFEEESALPTHGPDLTELRTTLERASTTARRERAPKLGLGSLSDAELHAAVIERTKNWAEVRPEWGLAGNATFIIAPRERSRHLDLGGRGFLQEYRFEEDADFAVLEQLMTGPMVVSHWINFQYYASTVDNMRYGSGNKLLHNVVGGHLGVFEGNGGDLRIGLSIQSLHDGERWVHPPLRLSVFIEAPRSAIDRLLEKHPHVGALVDNEWLHLFQLDTETRAVFARRNTGWTPVAS